MFDSLTLLSLSGFKNGNSTVEINGFGLYNYTYDVRKSNKAGRNLAVLSKTAETDMMKCDGCPHALFQKFYDYYGQADYGHQWITAAFEGSGTSLKSGNVDFSTHNNITRKGKSVATEERRWCVVLRRYLP